MGPRWDGWAVVMPDREYDNDVLAHRAMRIGVRCSSQFRRGKGKREAILAVEQMAIEDGFELPKRTN